jgi:ferredoxin--NADP+ reductase
MKIRCSTVFLVIAATAAAVAVASPFSLVVVVDAFVIPSRSTTHVYKTTLSSSISSRLYATTEDYTARIKKAGGGVPVVDAGGRRLFDPSIEGLLGETPSLDRRLNAGAAFLPAVQKAEPPSNVEIRDAQAWLEDIGDPIVPSAFAKASQPVTAQVLGRTSLITNDAPGDIQHVLMRLPAGFHYVEGQSLSVIPPGLDSKTGKPHKPRLYSIASTRYGDLLDGQTVSLCVRRAEFVDENGYQDPAKQGVCSGFLCDALPGTAVQVAGPVGKALLLPPEYEPSNPAAHSTDIIMVATGTGIAPFRAFLHRLFMEETTARHLFTGTAWLILGVPVTGGLLYKPELDAMQYNAAAGAAAGGGKLEIDYAISREMTNSNGGKLYVQDVLAENATKLFDRLENGAHLYVCGLKGMLPGILATLEAVAASRGMDWDTTLKKYKANNQWHVEVY